MNDAPNQPFRILASSVRSATTYGPALRRPKNATALFLWFNMINGFAGAGVTMKLKSGVNAAGLNSDTAATAVGGTVMATGIVSTSFTSANGINGPVQQLVMLHGDANPYTYEVWGCWQAQQS